MGLQPAAALNGGYQIAFLVGAIFAAAACAIGARLFRAGAPGQAAAAPSAAADGTVSAPRAEQR